MKSPSITDMSQSDQQSTKFDLQMRLGESYIEGRAVSECGEYTINIQGGRTCLVLPSEFTEKCENATIRFFTEKGTELKIKTEVEYNRDWIQIYDDYLTYTLSRDLPIAMTIECNYAEI